MRRSRGFSLLELLVAVALLGLLAVLAVANYRLALAKARRLEPQRVLRLIWEDELQYNRDHGTFWPSPGSSRRLGGGIRPAPLPGTGRVLRGLHYLYRVHHTRSGEVRVYAYASSKLKDCRYDIDGDPFPDVWMVVNGSPPLNIRNDLTDTSLGWRGDGEEKGEDDGGEGDDDGDDGDD